MHKGVMLLMKAESTEEAFYKVESFMEEYYEDVWDWFVIGGRWSGTFNEARDEFIEKANEYLESILVGPKMGKFGWSTKEIEDNADALRKIWQELGQDPETTPWLRTSYNRAGYSDDVMPLVKCIDKVKSWAQNKNELIEKAWNEMLAEKEKASASDPFPFMLGYKVSILSNWMNDAFSFDSNVFDIDHHTHDISAAIENIDNYYAVIVDMHN